jgi:3-methyladenine DNA glycosylase AlkC
VYRSVANHLGDILKDNPTIAYATCERWVEEVSSTRRVPPSAASRLWIVRHALRLPAKKGESRAVQLRRLAALPGKKSTA